MIVREKIQCQGDRNLRHDLETTVSITVRNDFHFSILYTSFKILVIFLVGIYSWWSDLMSMTVSLFWYRANFWPNRNQNTSSLCDKNLTHIFNFSRQRLKLLIFLVFCEFASWQVLTGLGDFHNRGSVWKQLVFSFQI